MRAALASILVVFMAQTTLGDEAPIPGYTVVPIEWNVEVAPGQWELLNGTVQEVHAQALAINPDFQLKPVPPISEVKRDSTGPSRSPPNDRRGAGVKCGYWPDADQERIIEGVNYLRGVGGRPGNGPGPGACGRVSCSYKSAIWWCNDNPYFLQLNSFDQIANSAMRIVELCTWGLAPYVSGQNFEDPNWNTIVRHDDNNC